MTTKRQTQKIVDMSRGILELEREELLWNRKMLMDHMGYKNYRDVSNFIEVLCRQKHLKCEQEGKVEWYRTTGSGMLWLNNTKEGMSSSPSPDSKPAAGDNITILIDRFSSHWCGRVPLEEEYSKFSRSFMKARVPWLTSDEFYLFGCNRRGAHTNFPGSSQPLNGWNPTSAGRTARDRYLSEDLEELLSQEV
jgi:hypothetical protein